MRRPDEGPGGGGDWTLLTTARNELLGHLVQGALAAEGIECIVEAFNPSPGAWLKPFGDPLAPVRVYVRKRDRDAASLLLHEVDHRPVDPEAPPARRVRAMWLATMLVIAAATGLMMLEVLGQPLCVLGLPC